VLGFLYTCVCFILLLFLCCLERNKSKIMMWNQLLMAWKTKFTQHINNTHLNHNFNMKPHQLAKGTPYVKQFIIGFMKISQVTLVVARGCGSPDPPGQLRPWLSCTTYHPLYTVSQKTIHLTFDHNFRNIDRFSKFFHWEISKETLYVTVAESSTFRLLCC